MTVAGLLILRILMHFTGILDPLNPRILQDHLNFFGDDPILFIIQTNQRTGKSDHNMQYQELMFVSYFP